MHCMLDLETFGTGVDSMICTIGAVAFDPAGEGCGLSVDIAIDIEHDMNNGAKVDASTIIWWLTQSEPARTQLVSRVRAGVDIVEACRRFNTYIEVAGITHVWGNGATFDNVLLRQLFKRANVRPEWSFRKDMCYRTVVSMFGASVPFERVGTHHNAVDDARSQALHLQKVLRLTGLAQHLEAAKLA